MAREAKSQSKSMVCNTDLEGVFSAHDCWYDKDEPHLRSALEHKFSQTALLSSNFKRYSSRLRLKYTVRLDDKLFRDQTGN